MVEQPDRICYNKVANLQQSCIFRKLVVCFLYRRKKLDMGRPFKQELVAIESTFDAAQMADTRQLEDFLCNSTETPLLVIGSGGSFAVAEGFALCYQSLGGFSKAITPYEIKNEKWGIHKSKILIVTAGGNNADTLGVYEYVRLYEPKQLFVVCMSTKSKIARKIRQQSKEGILEFQVPFGKDGFLAVNSTIAMFSIMRKLFSSEFQKISFFCDYDKTAIRKGLAGIRTLLILYGGWGTPAALDIESKCSEAGLFNVQCADYRNFAHGRHHWISEKMDETAIITIAEKNDKKIRNRTLRLLPASLEIINIETDYSGIDAALELMVKAFYFVDILGDLCEIDPGRPHVPEYGRKIYGIKYNLINEDPLLKKLKNDRKAAFIFRKIGRLIEKQEWYEHYEVKLDSFLEKLQNTKYSGLIMDFDDTLYERNNEIALKGIFRRLNEILSQGVRLGIATGRGDSIYSLLDNYIEQQNKTQVWLGLYNGSSIHCLSDGVTEFEEDESIKKIYNRLQQEIFADSLFYKKCQISLRETDSILRDHYYELICEIIQNENYDNIKILKSGHAIDMIGANKGKQVFVESFRQIIGGDVLCIGDEGRIGQNDYDMLSENMAVSVAGQNLLGHSGWNIAPMGVRNVKATEYYLNCIKSENGTFIFECT